MTNAERESRLAKLLTPEFLAQLKEVAELMVINVGDFVELCNFVEVCYAEAGQDKPEINLIWEGEDEE